MKLLDKFNQIFGFTKTERQVVLFLVAAFVLGLGLKLYKSLNPSGPQFRYAAADSEFTARSASLAAVDSADEEPAAEVAAPRAPAHAALPDSGSIDINRATAPELERLPGIGKTMADRIVRFREENGPFAGVEDLRKVKGIGKKKLERLAPYCMAGK